MSAAPQRRAEPRETPRRPKARSAGTPGARTTARALGAERRRRERHFRRRRRDLLEDSGLALALTVVLLSMTAGLGVLALIELPLAGVVVASVLAERLIKRRRARARLTAAQVRARSRARRAQL